MKELVTTTGPILAPNSLAAALHKANNSISYWNGTLTEGLQGAVQN